MIENVTGKLHEIIGSYTTIAPIKHISLIVSIHNQQAGIIQCCLVFLFGRELDCAVRWERHWCCSLDYPVIIVPASGGLETTVPPFELAHRFSHSYSLDTEFFPVPVLLFHVVDTNTHTFQQVLYNNTFFHNGTAENLPPTAAGGSVHAKEFLYTTPRTYACPVQSGTHGGDTIHPHNHSNHKLTHVSDHDEGSPPQFYGVVETCSETKW